MYVCMFIDINLIYSPVLDLFLPMAPHDWRAAMMLSNQKTALIFKEGMARKQATSAINMNSKFKENLSRVVLSRIHPIRIESSYEDSTRHRPER